MVRKGQVHAGQLSHHTGAGLVGAEEDEEIAENLPVQGSMDPRDGGPRQLSHDTQPYHHSDESLLRRSYGGFGVSMHPQGFPISYRTNEEVAPREDPRNSMHRPYEQREMMNIHQPVDTMRWTREEEQGYEESTKQLAVAQMMAEMHQGNMLQPRGSNLMMMASQMGQGRYHPEFLQTGGRMLFGAPPPRVSSEERFPYQAEMMRQNPAMMFGMGGPPIEKGRFEELFQQQRGMMFDMAARSVDMARGSVGESRMQDFYLSRGSVVDPGIREGVHSRNHAEFSHPRVGMMMGMGQETWRASAESANHGTAEELVHDVALEVVHRDHPKVEEHVVEHSTDHYIEGPSLPPTEEHTSSDSTRSLSIIQPNHNQAPETVVPERVVVQRVPEEVASVANPVPIPSVSSLGVRDRVAEMVLEMERRDREKMQELSASDDSSSSEQSDSESDAEETEGVDKSKHSSIPAQVPTVQMDESRQIVHPVMNEPKIEQEGYSQESGTESDDSSNAGDNELDKNPSSVSSRYEADSPAASPPHSQAALTANHTVSHVQPRLPLKKEHRHIVTEELQASESSSSSSSEEEEDDEKEEDKEVPPAPPVPLKRRVTRKLGRRKAPNPRPKSPNSSDDSIHVQDIKSVRMPMWRWIGPKQTRSTRVTRQSVRKGKLTIRLVKRKAAPKPRGRRRKAPASSVPVTTESVPTAVPCAHPTSKRRGKVFQRVVMEDMVMMDGQIMTVAKRGRPRKVRPEEQGPPKKVGRPKKVKVEQGPPKKRGRPRKVQADGEPPKKMRKPKEKRARKPPLQRNIKLISVEADKEETMEKPTKEGPPSHNGPGGKDFGCPFCGKEFRCGFRLNKHMQTHIPQDGSEEKDKGTIKMQLALTPDREKRMVRFDQCSFCKQLFMDLKAHVRRVHNEAEEHLCSICGHVLRNKESLVAHEKRHKVVAAGKKEFVCKICGADFFFQTGLNQHSKRHLVERACICEICGKAFKTTKDLEKHKLVHTKPHSCPVCKRRFGQKSNMKAHMRQHSGDKPFKCDLCSAAFTHNVSLKTHKKNTHGIDWWKEHGKVEERTQKVEKLAIMNACLDYFGNTTGGNKWEGSGPPPPPLPPSSNPNPNPLHPLNPANPLNSINSMSQFTPLNHSAMAHNPHHDQPLHQFNPVNTLTSLHPSHRPHTLEDIKPII
ncbi:uncharacterized protein [Diadema setosum]|uniref:uncharacterized protein n=1 Tax=Diadema setosum TaxID=31175 RepID=UPI003B3A76A0